VHCAAGLLSRWALFLSGTDLVLFCTSLFINTSLIRQKLLPIEPYTPANEHLYSQKSCYILKRALFARHTCCHALTTRTVPCPRLLSKKFTLHCEWQVDQGIAIIDNLYQLGTKVWPVPTWYSSLALYRWQPEILKSSFPAYLMITGDLYDPLKCRSFPKKEPLNIGYFCGKRPIEIRDPMSLRHPVLVDLSYPACSNSSLSD